MQDLQVSKDDGSEEERNVLAISKPAYISTSHSKVKQKILEEEEYLNILEQIVERDFYPELSRLKLRSDYLDALDSNDVEKLRRIQIELDQATPSLARKETPRTFDVPTQETSDDVDDDESRQKTTDTSAKQKSNLTLDKFLFKNTSEDNASFEKIMELTRKKHREKHAWLYEKQLELEEQQKQSLALPSSNEEQLKALEDKPNNVDTWKYVPRNALMYPPEGVDLSIEEMLKEKGKKEQEIRHANTRFQTDPFNSTASQNALAKASEEVTKLKKAVGKIGIDGKLEQSNTTPNVRGYAFVASPSPAPGVDASPLMTWGEIEGTPMRLDATPSLAGQGPSFKIPEPPRREQIAHSLAEKASKQHREKRRKAFATATKTFLSPRNTPRLGSLTSSERLSKLSPAAQKLVKSNTHLPTGDQSLRSSYTPSPRTTGRSPFTPSSKVRTPGTSRTKTPGSNRKTEWSITDDLLQLPKS